MATVVAESTETMLNPEDRTLALLAIEAADEISALRQGTPSGVKALRALADVLTQSFSQAPQVDSDTVALFCHALGDARWVGQVATVPDLVARAAEISDGLQRAASTGQEERLEHMRVFCLALANAVIAYRQSLYIPDPAYRS